MVQDFDVTNVLAVINVSGEVRPWMKTLTFICITLLSGAIAGTLLGLINRINLCRSTPRLDSAKMKDSQSR